MGQTIGKLLCVTTHLWVNTYPEVATHLWVPSRDEKTRPLERETKEPTTFWMKWLSFTQQPHSPWRFTFNNFLLKEYRHFLKRRNREICKPWSWKKQHFRQDTSRPTNRRRDQRWVTYVHCGKGTSTPSVSIEVYNGSKRSHRFKGDNS